MLKTLFLIFLSLCIANASDGYVRLSDIDTKTMQKNKFVALNTLEENSEWVSLDSLNEDSFKALESNNDNLMVNILDLSDYVALEVFDTYNSIENTQEKYASVEEKQSIEKYDIVAMYEDMLKEEEKTTLSANNYQL